MYHSLSIREAVVSSKLSGKSLLQISKEMDISYSSIRRIWVLFKQGGMENLRPKYENCGPRQPSFYRVYRMSICLKRRHPNWGAPYILTLLSARYPTMRLPSDGTVQKWFRAKGLNKLRVSRQEQTIPVVKQVHDCWQIDAKENIELGNGSQACYLTTVDVKSGAVLEAPVFSLWQDQSSYSQANTSLLNSSFQEMG